MLNKLYHIFQTCANENALCIKDRYYTYRELALAVTGISNKIQELKPSPTKLIGVVTTDTFETYATFLAAWFSGLGFVPLNPKSPFDRNNNIIEQSEIEVVLSSTPDIAALFDISRVQVICTRELSAESMSFSVPVIPDEQVLCILFTSGSTGVPKGVPMSMQNINATLDSFNALGYELSMSDRFLQMFEFTFDMSMLSYLPAFLLGACVYSVADAKVKYMAAIKNMQKYEITFAAMVPSTLAFLRPYFNELKFNKLKYSILGGEPFHASLAEDWQKCVPNAQIVNISGPTETTMACMGYNLSKNVTDNKAHNGVLAFGKPWKNTSAIIVNEKLELVLPFVQGELCFAGPNVMSGYWKMPERNRDVFFTKEIDEKIHRYYRTGDMAFVDNDGDFMTCGRIDQQVKIQGHKVELSEIEVYARNFFNISNVAAIPVKDMNGFTEIVLCVESEVVDSEKVVEFLKTKLPWYMIPKQVTALQPFPYNLNGKIDRPALAKLIIL